jgi:hypothetical protein
MPHATAKGSDVNLACVVGIEKDAGSPLEVVAPDARPMQAGNLPLALSLLTVRMKLEGGESHECVIRPAFASVDRKFLLKLPQLEIGAHLPEAVVAAPSLTAEASQSSLVQLGLVAPQVPEPSQLDVTLERFKRLWGRIAWNLQFSKTRMAQYIDFGGLC